jgi:hypothetical protein
MAKKILQSFALFQTLLPAITVGGRDLPEVTLPRGKYSATETYKGMRPVIELDEDQVARVEADPNVMRMFQPHGSKGKIGYRWLDHMPEHFRTAGDRVVQLQQENAVLRNELRKRGIEIPGEGPVAAKGVDDISDARRDDSAGPLSEAILPGAEDLARTPVGI